MAAEEGTVYVFVAYVVTPLPPIWDDLFAVCSECEGQIKGGECEWCGCAP